MKKGSKMTDEQKARLSEAARNPETIAKKITQESNRKRSQSEIGIPKKSALQRQKSSEHMKQMNQQMSKEVQSEAGKRGNASKAFQKTVQSVMLDFLRSELIDSDYYKKYIHNFLNEAKNDPNSPASRMLASGLFNEKMLDKLDAESTKMMARDIEFTKYRIRQTLYDKQQEVYDNAYDKEIEVICTRRSGKTELNARLVLADAIANDNHHAVYINRTFENAVGQLGKPLIDLMNQLGISFNGSPGGGIVSFSNGSDIRFGGFNNKGELDKLRGWKFSRVVIDEIGHLRNVKGLIEEILEPAMIDYGKSAQIFLTGTPPRIKKSYAYELWHNPKIKHYHWSFLDNPYIPEKESVIKDYCERHGVNEQSLIVQREFFGNMEAFDTDAMIFRGYKATKNIPNIIKYGWIGVDWGTTDNAAVVTVISDGKAMYVTDCWLKNNTTVTEKLDEVQRQFLNLKQLKPQHNPMIIIDHNEKDLGYELQVTYKIPEVALAYKYDKLLAIDQLAEWFRNDVCFVQEGLNNFIDELESTVWKRDSDTDELLHEIDDEIYHPNAIFALLYVSRQFAYEVLGLTDTNKEANVLC